MHVIGTAGHVDHGKSTLVERLTGIDPDRFDEEKRRGLTIDLGFAWLRLPSGMEVGLIDVPGHERFIKNMLAGAGGITVCLFVVAANEGWMPQSAEHLAIIDVLGVSSGVVALTKADTVDDELIELASAEVEEQLASSSLLGAPVVPCSAVTGMGMDELVEAIDGAVASAPPARDLGRPRLWIDRSFTIAGAGTVVTGTLAGGTVGTGDEIEIAPERRRARVRSIQNHKKQVSKIGPGNRVALNLAGLERLGAERGDAVVKRGQWRATGRVDALLRVLEPPGGGRYTLEEKGAHLLYAGSAETPVRIKLLGSKELFSGQSGFAQIYLRDVLPLARGDRFVLRDAGRALTLGGGEVLDPLPPPARRNDRARTALLDNLVGATAKEAVAALVEANGRLDAAEAYLRSGVAPEEAGAPGSSSLPHDVVRAGHLLLSRSFVQDLESSVRRSLAAHHAGHPLERGITREALRAAAGLDSDVFDALVSSIEGIVEENLYIRLASHRIMLAPEQQRQKESLLEVIDSSGFTPPLTRDLKADAALLRSLAESGELVRIGDFFLTSARAQEARRRVRALIKQTGPVTVAEIRNLLDTSRKYAVPLSEWLDGVGATRRQGDVRALGPNP